MIKKIKNEVDKEELDFFISSAKTHNLDGVHACLENISQNYRNVLDIFILARNKLFQNQCFIWLNKTLGDLEDVHLNQFIDLNRYVI